MTSPAPSCGLLLAGGLFLKIVMMGLLVFVSSASFGKCENVEILLNHNTSMGRVMLC